MLCLMGSFGAIRTHEGAIITKSEGRARTFGLLPLQASSSFLCQMMAENLDPVWNL